MQTFIRLNKTKQKQTNMSKLLTLDENNKPAAQIPQCTNPISHNAPICNKMCIPAHISVTKWCSVGFLSALWDWEDGSIISPEVKLPYIWPQTYICNVFSHWQRLCSDINTRCAWYTNFRGKSLMQQAFSIIFQSWHTVTNKSQDIIFGISPCCYAAGRRLWCTYLMW